MPFDELDPVYVTRPQEGEDPYAGRHVRVPEGELGTVILVGHGDTCDVEFLLRHPDGSPYSAVLYVPKDDLIPYEQGKQKYGEPQHAF